VEVITIVHLYPREMNIYGDIGNVIALRRRLEWRGMEARVDNVGVGTDYDLTAADIVVAGGGEDLSQMQVAADLQTRAGAVRQAVDDGVVFLTVCGTYQLFGHRFVTATGEVIPGIGVFDCETIGGGTRMIGNIVAFRPPQEGGQAPCCSFGLSAPLPPSGYSPLRGEKRWRERQRNWQRRGRSSATSLLVGLGV
jgi:CobQ-like glutamine amidotransferase family enzyme